jgi:hypothetical protein
MCDVKMTPYLSVGVEAHAAVKISDEPFPQIHYLRTASALVSKLELPTITSLK